MTHALIETFRGACSDYEQAKRRWEKDTKSNSRFVAMCDALSRKRKAREKLEAQGIKSEDYE